MASTAERRRSMAGRGSGRSGEPGSGGSWKRLLAGVGFLCLATVFVAWLCGFFSPPRAVTELVHAVDQRIAEYDRVARGELPLESIPSSSAVFEKFREVPREYRDQVGRQFGRLGDARERAEIGSYFSLPPAQRQAELDRRIKADEARRKQREAERETRDRERAAGGPAASGNQSGGPGGGPGGPGGGPGGPGGGPGGPGGGPGGPGGGGGGRTEEDRNLRLKARLDKTTPEERAQRTEYRRAMDERRGQLGMSGTGFPGR